MLSDNLCRRIATDASFFAQRLAPRSIGPGAGTGAYSIRPFWGGGKYGLRVGKKYMLYQNYGIKPFIMWNLEGKTIPMLQKGGSIQFRVAHNVGGHQIVKRDPKTGRIMIGNKPIRWRHPGLKPKLFLQTGMSLSLKRNMPAIANEMAREYFDV